MGGFLPIPAPSSFINSDGNSVFTGHVVVSGGNLGVGPVSNPTRALVLSFIDNEGIVLDNTWDGGGSAITYRTSFSTPDTNWCSGIYGPDDSFRISNNSALGTDDKIIITTSGKLHVSFTDNEGLLLDNTWNGGGSAITYRTSFSVPDTNWCSGIYGPDDSFHIANNSYLGATDFLMIDTSGNIEISGNLTVQGTTTTVNSTTVTIDDKNLELGSVASPSDTTANLGGITLKGATDKTILWTNSTDAWHFNQGIDITGDINLSGSLSFDGGGTTVDQILDQDDLSGDSATAIATQQSIKAYVDAQVEMQSGWTDGGTDVYLTTSTDKVGIGTSSPSTKLHVVGTGGNLETMRLYHGSAVYGADNPFFSLNYNSQTLNVYTDVADHFYFKASHQDIHIDTISGKNLVLQESGGKVGIGTSSPGVSLHVSTSENKVMMLDNTWNGGDCGLVYRTSYGSPDVNWASGIKGSDDSFRISNSSTVGTTDRLTIDSSGNVGIGVTDPDEQLELTGRIHLGQIVAPGTTTDKLYNVGGTLTWNGSALASGSGDVTMASNTTTDNVIVTTNGTGAKAVQQANTTTTTGGNALTIDSASGLTLGAGGNELTITESSNHITLTTVQDNSDLIFKCTDAASNANELIKLDGSAKTVQFPQDEGIYVGDGGEIRIYADNAGPMHFKAYSSNHDFIFSTYPGGSHVEAMRLDGGNDDGRVSVGGVASALATLDVNGSMRVKHVAKTADYTVDSGSGNGTNDYIVGVNTSGGSPITITLLAAATAGAGRIIVVKDEGNTAEDDNITIDGNGSETIDGSANAVISGNRGSVTLYCDGSNWHIM